MMRKWILTFTHFTLSASAISAIFVSFVGLKVGKVLPEMEFTNSLLTNNCNRKHYLLITKIKQVLITTVKQRWAWLVLEQVEHYVLLALHLWAGLAQLVQRRAGRSGQRIPVGMRFSISVQIGPGAHLASCTMRTRSLPGVTWQGRGVDHPSPSSTTVKERVELLVYSPCGPSWPVIGWTLPLTCMNHSEVLGCITFSKIMISRKDTGRRKQISMLSHNMKLITTIQNLKYEHTWKERIEEGSAVGPRTATPGGSRG